MTRKLWLWIALAVLLGGFSLYLNKDRFAKDRIHIIHRSRPARMFGFRNERFDPLVFGIDRPLKLTCVEVIPVIEIATNKYPQAIWHLVSESNSEPTTEFFYGGDIPGMRPSVKGATADPLEAGVKYRLLIEAGPLKAEHNFELARQ